MAVTSTHVVVLHHRSSSHHVLRFQSHVKGAGGPSRQICAYSVGANPSLFARRCDNWRLTRRAQTDGVEVEDAAAAPLLGDPSFESRLAALKASTTSATSSAAAPLRTAPAPFVLDAAPLASVEAPVAPGGWDAEAAPPVASSPSFLVQVVSVLGVVLFAFLFGLSDVLFQTAPAQAPSATQQLSQASRSKLTQLLDAFVADTPQQAAALAKAAMALDRPQDAVRAWTQALKIDDSSSFDALTGLVDANVALQRYSDALLAVTSFESAHVNELMGGGSVGGLDATDAALLRARVLSLSGDAQGASNIYDALIVQRPEDFRPLLAKGLALKKAGRQLAADKLFLQARYLAPKEARTLVDSLIGDR